VKRNGSGRMGKLSLLAIAAAVLGVFLLTGCTPKGSDPGVQQLTQQFPWLASLGSAVIQFLIQQFGSNLNGLLAAAAALVGG
jgi:outer membrane murein-binding lipoprotein Lpp